MALVLRNGRFYVYRSVRRAGRVTSEYVGSGALAACHALCDLEEREDREEGRRQEREERKQADELDRALDELAEQAQALARDALNAAGYHQHDRGKWRKRRVSSHRKGESRRADDGLLGGGQSDRTQMKRRKMTVNANS